MNQNNSITVDTVGLTFDAFDRMVEQNRSGSYTQIVYSPTGFKMQLMNAQTPLKDFAPLPGGTMAVYIPGSKYYRHADWLGSSRFASTTLRTMYSDAAYAPFGEPYAQSGTVDLSFTGMNSDTTSGDYDFLAREYSNEGRWVSPDPAGLAAVDPTNPQSWNRYSYVTNNPLAYIDPLGLQCVTVTYPDGTSGYADDGTPPPCEAAQPNVPQQVYVCGAGSSYQEISAGNTTVGGCFPTIDGVLYQQAIEQGLQEYQQCGNGGCGNSSGGGGPYPNPAIPQSILNGIVYQLRYAVGSLVKQAACGNTPQDAMLKSIKSGAVRGTVRGAIAGFAGGEFMGGIGGIPGSILGGFMGGTFGAAGGVITAGGRAMACSIAGAYDQ